MLDLLDPRTWPEPGAVELYLDNRGVTFAVLDHEDYLWAVRWVWKATPSKSSHKLYAVRATRTAGKPRTIYLHKAIVARMGPPPSPRHTIGDHLDGESLNCRRKNLRWATPSMNRRNLYGQAALQPDLLEGVIL